MLWSLTKWNHKLSTMRLTRWWLRMTVLDRLILVIGIDFLFLIYSFFAFILWLIHYGGSALSGAGGLLGSLSSSHIPVGIRFIWAF